MKYPTRLCLRAGFMSREGRDVYKHSDAHGGGCVPLVNGRKDGHDSGSLIAQSSIYKRLKTTKKFIHETKFNVKQTEREHERERMCVMFVRVLPCSSDARIWKLSVSDLRPPKVMYRPRLLPHAAASTYYVRPLLCPQIKRRRKNKTISFMCKCTQWPGHVGGSVAVSNYVIFNILFLCLPLWKIKYYFT